MLDFLLVLGQIPGTDFQITFNEMVLGFLACLAYHQYRLHRRTIRRWAKRTIYARLYRRYSFTKRLYWTYVIEINRLQRRFKRSRAFHDLISSKTI